MILKVRVERNLSIIEGVLKRRIMIWAFKKGQSALYNLLANRASNWIVEDKDYYFVAEETGEDDYLQNEHKKWQDFLITPENQVKGYDEYIRAYGDIKQPLVQSALRYIKKHKDKITNGIMQKALGGRTVIDLFNSFGIFITYELVNTAHDEN